MLTGNSIGAIKQTGVWFMTARKYDRDHDNHEFVDLNAHKCACFSRIVQVLLLPYQEGAEWKFLIKVNQWNDNNKMKYNQNTIMKLNVK